MTKPVAEFRKPRVDDTPLWNILSPIIGYSTVLVAHQIKLFPFIDEQPRTLSEIREGLFLAPRPAEAMLALCTSLGLLEIRDERYALTPFSEDYLLESGPAYCGDFLDFAFIANHAVFSFESVRKTLLTDAAQVYGGEEIWMSHEQQAELARGFTHAMHGQSLGAAFAWPNAIDLSEHRTMLDIGGGSGVHSIGAALNRPHLNAVVFDLAPVCEVAETYIDRHGLRDRVKTRVGDMWNDAYPNADLHFLSLIYHDWPMEKCRFLTRKSFESLPSGGRLVIHEMLLNDDKSGPTPVAAYNIAMLLWTEGRQYSGRELSNLLAETGFRDVVVKPTFGHWSVVTGCKP